MALGEGNPAAGCPVPVKKRKVPRQFAGHLPEFPCLLMYFQINHLLDVNNCTIQLLIKAIKTG
jgi:hypothetical protein